MEMIARVSFRAPSRLYARIHHKDVLRGADVQFLGVDWDNVTLVCRKCGHPVTPGEFGKPVGRIE